MNCRVGWVAMLIGVLALAGCGGGKAKLETVEGKVTLNGAPLAGAFVQILPKDASSRLAFSAKTDVQGHFLLGPSDKPQAGAAPGAYTLMMTTTRNTNGDENAPPPKELVPAPYSSPGVDFEVPAGGVTAAKFDLVSAKKKK
jgi:hypothetical protein